MRVVQRLGADSQVDVDKGSFVAGEPTRLESDRSAVHRPFRTVWLDAQAGTWVLVSKLARNRRSVSTDMDTSIPCRREMCTTELHCPSSCPAILEVSIRPAACHSCVECSLAILDRPALDVRRHDSSTLRGRGVAIRRTLRWSRMLWCFLKATGA